MQGLLEARQELWPLLFKSHARLKDLLFLDIALDSTVRTAIERGYEELNNAGPEVNLSLKSCFLSSGTYIPKNAHSTCRKLCISSPWFLKISFFHQMTVKTSFTVGRYLSSFLSEQNIILGFILEVVCGEILFFGTSYWIAYFYKIILAFANGFIAKDQLT